jgi:hypothetical protein
MQSGLELNLGSKPLIVCLIVRHITIHLDAYDIFRARILCRVYT